MVTSQAVPFVDFASVKPRISSPPGLVLRYVVNPPSPTSSSTLPEPGDGFRGCLLGRTEQ